MIICDHKSWIKHDHSSFVKKRGDIFNFLIWFSGKWDVCEK